jgi:Zn-dependent peptidase ImmA (M78 family)
VPISRMDLADFGSPEAIAQGILKLVPDLPIPVPIEDLARQLDIIDIMPLETDGFEGGLLTDENKAEGIILVNESNPRQRRRFTVGHELGHFLSPWHKPRTPDGFLCSADDMRMAFPAGGGSGSAH